MARLLHCSTHSSETIPLVDGNKRLGWLAVVVFYGLNDVDLDAPDDPAYELVMAVARREMSIEEIASVLAQWH